MARRRSIPGLKTALKALRKVNPSAFDRCVADVSKKGGAYDPRAVCASAGRKKYGQKEMTRRSVAGRKRAARKRSNPKSVRVRNFTGTIRVKGGQAYLSGRGQKGTRKRK